MTNTEGSNAFLAIEAAVGDKNRGALIQKELTQVLLSHGINGFTIEEVRLIPEDQRPDPRILRLCCDFRKWPPCWFCAE